MCVLVMPAMVAGQSPSVPAASSTLGAPDGTLVEHYTGQGVGEVGSVFLAMTQVDAEPVGDLGAQVVATFPTGNTADMTVTLVPDQTGDPGVIDVTASTNATGFAFELTYFVPYAFMPDDVEQTMRAASPDASVGHADAQLALAAEPVTAGADGVAVVVTAVVDQFKSHTTSEFLKILQDRLGTAAQLDGAFKAVKALDTVRGMAAMSGEYAALTARIDAAERCGRNPTSPLTQKAYDEDPGALDRILQQVESTRSEVQANTLVSVAAILDKTASSLVKGVPWLGYIVGPATAWSQATLRDMNELLVAELERAITPCTPDACNPAAAPGQPDAGPDAPGLTTPDDPTRPAASCAAISGTITRTYHEEYIDPAHDLRHVVTDRITLNVRFDRQGAGWVDAGSTFTRDGSDHETEVVGPCGPSVDDSSWTNSGSFPLAPGEDDGNISAEVDSDGTAWVSALVVATLHGHKVRWEGGDEWTPCEQYQTDYSQGGYEWAWYVGCGPDQEGLMGTVSDDGTSADFACSQTETVPMNTGTQTTTWEVTGTLTIAP